MAINVQKKSYYIIPENVKNQGATYYNTGGGGSGVIDYSQVMVKNATKTVYNLDLPFGLNDGSIFQWVPNTSTLYVKGNVVATGEVMAYALNDTINIPSYWGALRFLREASLGNTFYWLNGVLNASTSGSGGVVNSSTWSISGSDIYYGTGNVRIAGVGNALQFDTTGAAASASIKVINDYTLSLLLNRGGAPQVDIRNTSGVGYVDVIFGGTKNYEFSPSGLVFFDNNQAEKFIRGRYNGGAIRLRSNNSASTDRGVQLGMCDNNGTWTGSQLAVTEFGVGVGVVPLSGADHFSVSGAGDQFMSVVSTDYNKAGIILRRGTTSDAYEDYKLYTTGGELICDKNRSGADVNMFAVSYNANEHPILRMYMNGIYGWRYSAGDSNSYNYITNTYATNGTEGIKYVSGTFTSSQDINCHRFQTRNSNGTVDDRLIIKQNGRTYFRAYPQTDDCISWTDTARNTGYLGITGGASYYKSDGDIQLMTAVGGTGHSTKVLIKGNGCVGINATDGNATSSLDVCSATMAWPASSGSTRNGMLRVGYSDHSWGGTELNFGIVNDWTVDYPAWIQAQAPGVYNQSRPIHLNPNGGLVKVGGNLNVVGEVTAYYSSDASLKTDIKPFTALDIIHKFQPKTFKWNEKAKELNDKKDNRNNFGLIAQDVEKVLPELIHNIYNDYKSVDYVQLIPILIQAVQEQQKQINELKQDLNYYKNCQY